MGGNAMDVMQAAITDLEGIKALLKANHADNVKEEDRADGFVTTNITDEQLSRLITAENGVTIAKENDTVMAFAFEAPWEFWMEWPMFKYMTEILEEYSFGDTLLTTESTYQYGPICLDKTVRGTGLFEKVFDFSLAMMKDRYPVMATFINQINGRSYAAHTRKAGMTEVGKFDFNGNHYYMMACDTVRSAK